MTAGFVHPSAAGEQQIPHGLKSTRDDNLPGAPASEYRKYCGFVKLSSRAQRGICLSLALVSLLFLTVAAPAQQIVPWNKVQAPTLPAFTPAQPTRVQLANGMVIFLQPDHELPLISATARIRGGSVQNAEAQRPAH